jgi:group I intron endonuclease
MIIYIIENLENNKCYIGQTTRTLEQRFREHCGNSGTSVSPKLKNAIKKYGQDCFSAEILWQGECSQEELDEKEISFIRDHNTLHPNGYNLTIGGSGGRHSTETKLILSKKSKQMWNERGQELRLDRQLRGRSEESKKKVSETLRRNYQERPEIRERISKSTKGFPKSEETKERMRLAIQRMRQEPDYKEKMSLRAQSKRKPVYCFTDSKTLFRVFPSLSSVETETGIALHKIRKSIASSVPYLGYYYSYSAELPTGVA